MKKRKGIIPLFILFILVFSSLVFFSPVSADSNYNLYIYDDFDKGYIGDYWVNYEKENYSMLVWDNNNSMRNGEGCMRVYWQPPWSSIYSYLVSSSDALITRVEWKEKVIYLDGADVYPLCKWYNGSDVMEKLQWNKTGLWKVSPTARLLYSSQNVSTIFNEVVHYRIDFNYLDNYSCWSYSIDFRFDSSSNYQRIVYNEQDMFNFGGITKWGFGDYDSSNYGIKYVDDFSVYTNNASDYEFGDNSFAEFVNKEIDCSYVVGSSPTIKYFLNDSYDACFIEVVDISSNLTVGKLFDAYSGHVEYKTFNNYEFDEKGVYAIFMYNMSFYKEELIYVSDSIFVCADDGGVNAVYNVEIVPDLSFYNINESVKVIINNENNVLTKYSIFTPDGEDPFDGIITSDLRQLIINFIPSDFSDLSDYSDVIGRWKIVVYDYFGNEYSEGSVVMYFETGLEESSLTSFSEDDYGLIIGVALLLIICGFLAYISNSGTLALGSFVGFGALFSMPGTFFTFFPVQMLFVFVFIMVLLVMAYLKG